MRALDRKLWRDLGRLRAQGLAIALVLAAGVATLVLAVGAARSLEETRAAYYERHRMADIFATLTRAPLEVADRIAALDGVQTVQTRVVRWALLDVPGMAEPATGVFVGLPPDGAAPLLNIPHLRAGRLPEARDEVAAAEAFAEAHGLRPGDRVAAILNGARRELTLTGILLSPEYVYAMGPGDVMPDDRRFGVFFMPGAELAAAFDLTGAFDDLTVALTRGADEAALIEEIDAILAPWGGVGAHGRKDQLSNAFLDAELTQLRGLALVMPPIFLLVAAFLVNVTLARLVALEREQIGLMKALGYGPGAIGAHYLKQVALLAAIGTLLGWALGWALGRAITEHYGQFFKFPFLIFLNRADVYLIGGALAFGAALAGGVRALWGVLALAPATAMSPPAPPRFRHLSPGFAALAARLPRALTMALRNILRGPVRAGMTCLGLALSVALMIGSMFAGDSIEHVIEATWFHADRQDATLIFPGSAPKPLRAVEDARRLPGVIAAEPYRGIAAQISAGHVSRRVFLTGRPPGADLSRVIDADLRPVDLPPQGIALSAMLAEILGVRAGDTVQVELLEGHRRTLDLPVSAVIAQFLGLGAHMDLDALNAAAGDGAVVKGVHLRLDPAAEAEFFAAVKAAPAVAAVALQRRALDKFRATLAENLMLMTGIYTILAVVIAFGVVYNTVRIQLSERARELASLRVLGFTRWEVSGILLAELALLATLAAPLGWGLGWTLAWLTSQGIASELYQVPLIVAPATYGLATAVFAAVCVVSALIVRRRIDRFDLVAVLKSRE